MKKYKILILPFAKSAVPKKGRIGPEKLQNWYQGCRKAVKLNTRLPHSELLILTGFKVPGEPSEADCYISALKELGATKVKVIRKGLDTISQIQIAMTTTKKMKAKLIIVSTLLHFPRIWWLSKGENIHYFVVIGIPRPLEVITDIILDFIFPILDVLGLRRRFQTYTQTRRENGTL